MVPLSDEASLACAAGGVGLATIALEYRDHKVTLRGLRLLEQWAHNAYTRQMVVAESHTVREAVSLLRDDEASRKLKETAVRFLVELFAVQASEPEVKHAMLEAPPPSPPPPPPLALADPPPLLLSLVRTRQPSPALRRLPGRR